MIGLFFGGLVFLRLLLVHYLAVLVRERIAVFILSASAFPSTEGLSEKELEKLYFDYAKSYGDCEAPKDISAHHGSWELVGQRPATNIYCGSFKKYRICDRVDLHGQSDVLGQIHAGDVFVHRVHMSCDKPQCSVCCFSGFAVREADKMCQRLKVASQRFGLPQHVIVSPPDSAWGLAEFHHSEYMALGRKALYDRGFHGGSYIFHGFTYADYYESVKKGVLYGWRWHPHIHALAFRFGGYGECRSCPRVSSARYSCLENGFVKYLNCHHRKECSCFCQIYWKP